MSEKLGRIIPLIIVNCIIIARANRAQQIRCCGQHCRWAGDGAGLRFVVFPGSIREVLSTGCISFSDTGFYCSKSIDKAGGYPWMGMISRRGVCDAGADAGAVNQLSKKKHN